MTAGGCLLLYGAIWMSLLMRSAVFVTAIYVGPPSVMVDAGQGSPPELLDDVQTKFQVPFGQKQFRLVCPVKVGSGSQVMVQWKKDDEQIGFDFNNRYKLSRSDRELRIKNLQISDSGTYQCQAINGFGHRELDFELQVYDPASEKKQNAFHSITLSEKASPPKWYNETEMKGYMLTPIRLPLGGKLQLRCPAKGNPLPQITWLRNDKPVGRDALTFEHSSALLTLEDLHASDSGEYVCRLENQHGVIQATFHVRVGDFFNADEDGRWLSDASAAEQSPIIDEPLNSTVRVDHTAQFQCKVRSQHQPLIKWLKRVDDPVAIKRADANATLIHANNMDLLLLEQPHTTADLSNGVYINRLVIPNANFHHAGTYICVVTNADGNIVYRTAHLEIIPDYDQHQMLSDGYIYIGAPVVLAILAVIAYAIYFLCRSQQSTKGHEPNSSTANSVKPVTAVRTTASLRPPPPNMPPPQAPMSPFPIHQGQQQLSSSSPRYPLLRTQISNGSQSPAQRCHPYIATIARSRKLQHPGRPIPIHRTYADDDSSNFYEASPQPHWAQTLELIQHQHDYDSEYPKGRLQPYPSMYNCSELENFSDQQQPFITPIQRRDWWFV